MLQSAGLEFEFIRTHFLLAIFFDIFGHGLKDVNMVVYT